MPPITQHRNRVITVETAPIVENALARTHLTVDMAAASGTLTVANIEKFAVADFVWINPFSERSEIIAMHASTAPSGSTLTLAANTGYAHYAGEPVYYVEFNQIEWNHAATLAGSKSVLATNAIEAGTRRTAYLDISQTTGFYFARFKDSIATTYSGYSDGVTYGGFAANTVGAMIDKSLSDLKLQFSDTLTIRDCYNWLNDGIREIKGKIRRWPEHYTDNAIIGQTTRGSHVFSMPSDIYDSETDKSIEALRIGTGKNLIYKDPQEFEALLAGTAYTQVRTQASAADTSLAVDNSYDFDDSGTLSVYVSGTKDSFTYTAVTRDTVSGATAAFTGIPASGDDAIGQTTAVDVYVWQNEEEGEPTSFTVRNGQIEVWPLPDSTLDNQNVYLDYNTTAAAVDTEGDTIDYQRYGVLEPYLKWRMWCKEKENGMLNPQNGWYAQFKERLNDAIRTLGQSRNTKWQPKINRMSRGNSKDYSWLQSLDVTDQ